MAKVKDWLWASEVGSRSVWPDAWKVLNFGLKLEGPAQTWYRMKQMEVGNKWKFEDVERLFLEQYAGQATEALLDARLEDMKFSRKADFTTFTSRWMDLVAQRYPSEWASHGSGSHLLGTMFAALIQKSDLRVWAKAFETGPQSLTEWRVAVQNAITVVKVTEEARVRAAGHSSSASSSSRGHQGPPSTVRANAVEDLDVFGEEEDPRAEGETLSQMEGNTKRGKVDRAKRAPVPRLYTDEEWDKVKKLGLCGYCAGKGHLYQHCPDRKAGKPRTKATAQQLNA